LAGVTFAVTASALVSLCLLQRLLSQELRLRPASGAGVEVQRVARAVMGQHTLLFVEAVFLGEVAALT
jgi:hypothetical protein